MTVSKNGSLRWESIPADFGLLLITQSRIQQDKSIPSEITSPQSKDLIATQNRNGTYHN